MLSSARVLGFMRPRIHLRPFQQQVSPSFSNYVIPTFRPRGRNNVHTRDWNPVRFFSRSADVRTSSSDGQIRENGRCSRRVHVYCTASSYNFDGLQRLCASRTAMVHRTPLSLFSDSPPATAADVRPPNSDMPSESNIVTTFLGKRQQQEFLRLPCNSGDVFLFRFGSFVSWGADSNEIEEILRAIGPYEETSLPDREVEVYNYGYGDTTAIVGDEIVLDRAADRSTLLAISFGLAQSVRLNVYENEMEKAIQLTKHLPEELAKYGEIKSMNRRQLFKQMGLLLATKTSLNLVTDLSSTPEYFYEVPNGEAMYKKTRNILKVQKRVDVVNQHVTIVGDIYDLMREEHHSQKGHRLEWIIIWLISVEICLELGNEVELVPFLLGDWSLKKAFASPPPKEEQ
eukprot:TRINITY_DN416_c0_g1_i3.p1 TRINITY_DN416_c0_g1~~TRINITY_DN416_c0_g1_i3.p1  ORF type:complete len:400 (-),score=63.33 TRINITY_DN416_c0_g1_i3:568-1767(-)